MTWWQRNNYIALIACLVLLMLPLNIVFFQPALWVGLSTTVITAAIVCVVIFRAQRA